jgi:hypothetical protein
VTELAVNSKEEVANRYRHPEAGIGYGYVTNRMEMRLHGDPRDVALRAAIPRTAGMS